MKEDKFGVRTAVALVAFFIVVILLGSFVGRKLVNVVRASIDPTEESALVIDLDSDEPATRVTVELAQSAETSVVKTKAPLDPPLALTPEITEALPDAVEASPLEPYPIEATELVTEEALIVAEIPVVDAEEVDLLPIEETAEVIAIVIEEPTGEPIVLTEEPASEEVAAEEGLKEELEPAEEESVPEIEVAYPGLDEEPVEVEAEFSAQDVSVDEEPVKERSPLLERIWNFFMRPPMIFVSKIIEEHEPIVESELAAEMVDMSEVTCESQPSSVSNSEISPACQEFEQEEVEGVIDFDEEDPRGAGEMGGDVGDEAFEPMPEEGMLSSEGDEAPAEESPIGQLPKEEQRAEEVLDEGPVAEFPGEQVSAEVITTEETPAENIAVEEAGIVEAPVSEETLEEAPQPEAPEIIVQQATTAPTQAPTTAPSAPAPTATPGAMPTVGALSDPAKISGLGLIFALVGSVALCAFFWGLASSKLKS